MGVAKSPDSLRGPAHLTERLYYIDSYVAEWQAAVEEIRGDLVFLDRTAFYPTSGGQPHDTGVIAGSPVCDVVEEGGRIAHKVESTEGVGSSVLCRIDWLRRYDHMQQHTGQHLLSSVFEERLGMKTLSFHMGPSVSTIELDAAELSPEQRAEVEDRTNALVREALPVSISFAQADQISGLRKASERSGELRVISIGDIDRSACGGTHVRSTAELGPIAIRGSEKVRGHVRLEFVCGSRALARQGEDYRLLTELSHITGTPFQELPSAVAELKSRLAVAEKEVQRYALASAKVEGEILYEQTTSASDGIRRITLEVAVIDDFTRNKLQACAAQGPSIVLAISRERSGVLIACSPDAGVNAGSTLRNVLAAAGARGGGSSTLAQGVLPGPQSLEALKQALGF